MFQCGKTVFLTIRFLDVAKFAAVTPQSILLSCRLSFPIGVLKMSFVPNIALKSNKNVKSTIYDVL
jgi:hypothetical protein